MLYKEYFKKIYSIMGEVEKTQAKHIEDAAKLIADSVEAGGILHVFGCGHSQMYAMEVFYRAGGLVTVNAILTPALSLEPKARLSSFGERVPGMAKEILDCERINEGDVLFIASTSARNNVPVEMAMEAKKRGMKVIVLISSAFANCVPSRHVSGKKAHEFADVVLDNCGQPGDALMSAEGVAAKFGPSSSVVGFAILQAVIVQTIDNLAKRKFDVPVWTSANMEGGDDLNKKHFEKYSKIIPSL